MNKVQKLIPFLLFIFLLILFTVIFCFFLSESRTSFILIITLLLFGFMLGIFYKELILFLIPNEVLMNISYLQFFQPMYEKFVAKSLNLLSENDIQEIIESVNYILEVPLIKNLIEQETKNKNFDSKIIEDIINIIRKTSPKLHLLGIDIKKGLGEPLTERLARIILKDKKKEDIIKSIHRIEALLYAISCTNQSKPSIREVKNELKKLVEYL